MMVVVAESPEWNIEHWPFPPPLKRVKFKDNIYVCKFVPPFPLGARIPRYIREDKLIRIFKKLWYGYDSKSWHIQPFERDDWFIEISKNFSSYINYLRSDSTPRLYAHLDSMKILGGGHLVICGHPGSGKSILGQMIGERLLDPPKHVIFEASDIDVVLDDKEEQDLCIIIDESLEHTATGSASAKIHDGNMWASGRKGLLWGVQVGTNADHREYANTTALVMKPCGIDINTWRWLKFLKGAGPMPKGPIYQATRFAMYRKQNFLGFAVMQRKHRPKDPVFYDNKAGTYATYKARARAYSMMIRSTSGSTGAINPITEEKHIVRLVKYLKKWCKEQHEDDPPNDEMCITLYGKAKLPQKNTAYVNRIIKWAKFRIKKERENERKGGAKTPEMIDAKGWDWLRASYDKWGEKPHTMYKVPTFPKMTWQEVADTLGEPIDGESLRRRTSRRLSGQSDFPPSTKELGDMGEKFVMASLPDPSHSRIRGNAGEPDILCTHPDGHTMAISVKYTEKEHFKERDNHPELAHWPYCVCVLVMPRLLELKVYALHESPQTINSRQGGSLTTPQALWKTIMQTIEDMKHKTSSKDASKLSGNDTEGKKE